MGLFSKRSPEPVVHPPVERAIHVRASVDAVVDHLDAYSGLWSPKRATEHDVQVGVTGGWVVLRLPEAIHPWHLHNLANWMLDCPGVRDGGSASGADGPCVIAASAAGPEHPAYRLVADPELSDSLCGWDDTGQGWTVHVPGNDVVRDEDVPVPRSISVPSGHGDWRTVTVLLEETGPGMNERNASTFRSRAQLRDRHISFVF